MGITSGLIFAVLATVGFCSGIAGSIGWVKPIITFINGASTISLANSMQGFLSKVEEHVNPTNAFTQGLELLETNKVKEAAASFARVPVDDPNYANAQGLIRIYRSDQSKTRGSPSKQNVLLLDPSYRAREAEREERRKLQLTDDQSGHQLETLEEDWRDVRDRLGVNSPQYVQYLIEKNIERQQAECDSGARAQGPR